MTNRSLKSNALAHVLQGIVPRVIACSGGIDSLLLATIAHRTVPAWTQVAHAISPAVPAEATDRVRTWANREGWRLELVQSGEFADENYLQNPANRCYYCKTHLYSSLHRLSDMSAAAKDRPTVLSGANIDDLGEYRPGLIAASENGVRHPYVEASIGKEDIRMMARALRLPFAELPASPCLASRLYTGTRVTSRRLHAVEAGERQIRAETGIQVVRCRFREQDVFIEVAAEDRRLITTALVARVAAVMRAVEPEIGSVILDTNPYKAGRSFLVDQG